jgi:hypothetical protein
MYCYSQQSRCFWKGYNVSWPCGKREKDHLEGPAVDGRLILKRILQKRNGEMKWLRVGQLAGSCKGGNEPLCAKERGEFLDGEPLSFSRRTLLP